MNYNFAVFKFLLFVILNFLFFFQSFFSLNFFFSSKIDEELIICFAIFFVFLLFINHIVSGLQDMLRSRIEIYLNVFLLVFKLVRKSLKRFKKHNLKSISVRNSLLFYISSVFFNNLSSFFNYQNALNNYLVNFRFKNLIDALSLDIELKSGYYKKFLVSSYNLELSYLSFLNVLFK